MTSVLNVDTIAAKDGTSPVALVKQVAPKAVFGMNLGVSTYAGVATNELPSNTLNIASGVDAGTGDAHGNYTTNMAGLENIYPDGVIAANNTQNVDIGVTTTALLATQQHDADTSSDVDTYGFTLVFGDLA
jgi:hypothetical protein